MLEYIPGDFVIIETESAKPRVVKVSTVDEDSVIYCEGWGEVRFYDKIKPIPLTPEILEKNGWEFYHGFYCSPNEEGVGMRLSSQTGYVWNACTSQMLLRSDINSVSDLQHLFFGLGINHKMEV